MPSIVMPQTRDLLSNCNSYNSAINFRSHSLRYQSLYQAFDHSTKIRASMSGYFISLDGIDGCGKSTQIRMLVEWLAKLEQPVVAVREPGGTKLGESLREILLHRTEVPLCGIAEMLLYMASRAQLVQEMILPAIAENKWVISDRFLLANVVYQSSLGVLSPEQIWGVGEIATAGRMPDLTFVLGSQRDRLESRGIEYMQTVRQAFQTQALKLGNSVVIIDAQQPIEAVHQAIIGEITRRFLA
jgi:dTMP kinase